MGRRVIVYSDGASRGNPGPAGAGALVLGDGGAVLREERLALGRTTNNVAEYEGALAGLEAAAELGARDVELRADSELLIRQLQGAYKVRAPQLQPLYEKVRSVLARFERVTLVHVPREENREADRLANEAIDGSTGPVPGDGPARPGIARKALDRLDDAVDLAGRAGVEGDGLTVEELRRRLRALAGS